MKCSEITNLIERANHLGLTEFVFTKGGKTYHCLFTKGIWLEPKEIANQTFYQECFQDAFSLVELAREYSQNMPDSLKNALEIFLKQHSEEIYGIKNYLNDQNNKILSIRPEQMGRISITS